MSEERYPQAKREHPSAYFVQDRFNEEELARLQLQDQMLTTSIGGVLPEQADPTSFHRVLDVGCGTGGWLIDMARTYPTIRTLAGVDVSARLVAFARAQAHAAGVGDRIAFRTGDALRWIDASNGFFDLVNQRLGMSYARVWEWPKLLQEYQRVTRSGGVIRITEASTTTENNSPALTQISAIAHQAYANAGFLFSTEPESIIHTLAHLMTQHGIRDVQTKEYHFIYRAGTPEGNLFAADMAALFHVGLPFLNKWVRVPNNYESLRQQAIKDMQQPDFMATWAFLTAWGHVSPR